MRFSTSWKPALLDLLQHQRAEFCLLLRPVDVRVLVRHRRKHVERAHARGRQSRISHGGVLDVERRVVREDVPIFDFV